MLGYIISDKEKIKVKEHEIQSFDILHKTDLNIFVVENNNVIYKMSKHGHIQIIDWFISSGYRYRCSEVHSINYVAFNGHVQLIEWIKNSGYEFKYTKCAFNYGHVQVSEWFKNHNVKKVIKWSNHKFNKTIKYKTKNNYIKGYNKN